LPEPTATEPARRSFARGAAWSALDFWGQQLGGLLALLLVGRIVGPEALGLMATAQIAVALMMVTLLDGFSDALVQRRRIARAHVDTTFWLLFCLGCAAGLVLAAAAIPASWLFGDPDLAPLMWLLAPGLPLVGVSAALQGVMQRQMRFGLLALRTVLAQGIGLAAALLAAGRGAGVEALAAHFLVARGMDAAILLAFGTRPGLTLSGAALRRVVGYGRHRVGNQLVGFVVMQADRFSVALLLGPVAIGIYAVAERIAAAFVNGLAGAASRAALPVLSARQADHEGFGRSLGELMLVLNLLAMPAFAGMALVSAELLAVLMDERWARAARPLALLALCGIPYTLTYLLSTAANARGRPELPFGVNLQVLPIRLAASLAAAPLGLMAVALANLAVTLLYAAMLLRAVRRVVPEAAAATRRGLALPATATAWMVLVTVAAGALLPPLDPSERLLAEVAVGVAAYAAALLVLAPALLLGALRRAAPVAMAKLTPTSGG
jgi:O-antigen/teichoic acid export membrane protein